jgi:hypothetical protein
MSRSPGWTCRAGRAALVGGRVFSCARLWAGAAWWLRKELRPQMKHGNRGGAACRIMVGDCNALINARLQCNPEVSPTCHLGAPARPARPARRRRESGTRAQQTWAVGGARVRERTRERSDHEGQVGCATSVIDEGWLHSQRLQESQVDTQYSGGAAQHAPFAICLGPAC